MDETHDLRIPNPGVLQDDLVETTGVPEVDAYLFSLVNILVLALRERLRCILVIGSYAHGGAAPDSDIDLCIVWAADSTPEDRLRGHSLWQHFARDRGYVLDPMWQMPETPLYDAAASSYAFTMGADRVEIPCGPLLKLAMRDDSILLWGEDVRPQIAPAHAPRALLEDALAAPVNWIRSTHYGSLAARIVPPLTDPSPAAPDRGYGNPHRVAILVTHVARALVFLETGEFLFDKRKVPDAFERHCGTEWAPMVRGIQDARQGELTEAATEDAYRRACVSLTGFLNHFLDALAARGIDPNGIPV